MPEACVQGGGYSGWNLIRAFLCLGQVAFDEGAPLLCFPSSFLGLSGGLLACCVVKHTPSPKMRLTHESMFRVRKGTSFNVSERHGGHDGGDSLESQPRNLVTLVLLSVRP